MNTNEPINWNHVLKEQKRRNFVENLKEFPGKAIKWIDNNKEVSVAIVTALGGAITFVVKTFGKTHNLREERYLKDRYCYDRSLGGYLELKRKLKTSDWVQINARKKNGERLVDILSDMHVLK